MRIREFILGKPESGPSALNRTTQIDIMHACNASFSTIEHILTRISQINYLTESRTSPYPNTACDRISKEAVRVKLTRRIT